MNNKIAVALLLILPAVASQAGAREVEVSQKGKTFQQQKAPVSSLKLSVGDTVSFRNDDPFFHNVYSASPVKSFDLGSYPQGQTRKVTFEQEGVVEIECAIHPQMKLRVEVAK
jgi:plastocyanin